MCGLRCPNWPVVELLLSADAVLGNPAAPGSFLVAAKGPQVLAALLWHENTTRPIILKTHILHHKYSTLHTCSAHVDGQGRQVTRRWTFTRPADDMAQRRYCT